MERKSRVRLQLGTKPLKVSNHRNGTYFKKENLLTIRYSESILPPSYIRVDPMIGGTHFYVRVRKYTLGVPNNNHFLRLINRISFYVLSVEFYY